MVAAEIVVSLGVSPGNRKTGDDPTGKIVGFMALEHRRARSLQVSLARIGRVERRQGMLPFGPLLDVQIVNCLKALEQSGPCPMGRLVESVAKAKRERKAFFRFL